MYCPHCDAKLYQDLLAAMSKTPQRTHARNHLIYTMYERGKTTHESIGRLFGLSRERTRQIVKREAMRRTE
jgi:DNA-directed RNA polymerase sigma subunit (sigma70/sigma32)